MSVKYFCDRCKAEIEVKSPIERSSGQKREYSIINNIGFACDICDSCYVDFVRFMRPVNPKNTPSGERRSDGVIFYCSDVVK